MSERPIPTPTPTDPGSAPAGAELEAMLAVGRLRGAMQAAIELLDLRDPTAARGVLEEALKP